MHLLNVEKCKAALLFVVEIMLKLKTWCLKEHQSVSNDTALARIKMRLSQPKMTETQVAGNIFTLIEFLPRRIHHFFTLNSGNCHFGFSHEKIT